MVNTTAPSRLSGGASRRCSLGTSGSAFQSWAAQTATTAKSGSSLVMPFLPFGNKMPQNRQFCKKKKTPAMDQARKFSRAARKKRKKAFDSECLWINSAIGENMHRRVEFCVKLCAIGIVIAASSGLAQAEPPEIVAVRQTLPQELYQQIRLGLAAPTEVERTVPVSLYEKLELRVELKATFQNPYDPDDLDLWAEFTAPSGKVWKIWGFYNPTSPAVLWMVRFTPTETGTWRYVVKVHDREGTAESKPREATVVASKHHGFVRIAGNKRYLQFTDGSPFYGVGMWYNDGYELFNRGYITEQGLDDLKQHGANFISFFHSPLETMGTGLGRYDENRAGRLDQIFEWCEQRDMFISWNIWFHSYFSEAVWGGGNARYGSNPYRLAASADTFFTSEEAWGHLRKVYRYMVARWGYGRALFLWFVVDEINGTEGWLRGGSEAGEQWCWKVHNFLKENDPYGRPTTG